MLVTLGALPLVLQLAIPEDHPSSRDTGEPVRRLVELAAWGLGGPLPECLTPITPQESARGIGHLPREVTVALGSTLLAAWQWIAFCALALLGRVLRSPRRRIAFYLVAPALLGLGTLLLPSWKAFDASMFNAMRESAIWKGEPAVLASYGPVLLVALVALAVLAIAVKRAPLRPSA